MASRRETREQQKGVEQALRALLNGGALGHGAMLPSVSEIAQEHGVSRYIAHRALQMVEGEGLFRAVPKVGSFAGTSDTSATLSQVFLTDDASPHPYRTEIQIGFDSRVAERGGMALSLELSASSHSWSELPVGGVFLLVREERLDLLPSRGPFSEAGTPTVRIGSHWREGEQVDLLSFDNEDGGYQATRHLLERGLKSIAFLGVHVPSLANGTKEWSIERESGWRRALREAGLPWHGMAFCPEYESDDAEGAQGIGCALARAVLERGDVRGVVAASDAVAIGFLGALQDEGVPREQWPAIVAFDNSEAARRHNITSLHLPWDEIGRNAADLLSSRIKGQLPPQPQHRAVPMRLIPRLSCRENWPSFSIL
jgi:GntR family transcriptional regulator of arabinose operon